VKGDVAVEPPEVHEMQGQVVIQAPPRAEPIQGGISITHDEPVQPKMGKLKR